MQHFKALRTRTKFAISLILGLCFALVTFGCTTGENQVSGFPPAFSSDIEISAVTVPEGIRLTFSNYSNIPPEMDWLGVVFRSWSGSEEPDWEANDPLGIMNLLSNQLESHNWGNIIEQVRQTGTVTFPLVQLGQRYRIKALFWNQELDMFDSKKFMELYTECVVDEGIYLNRNISLNMNNDRTGVALSIDPAFTSDVQFGEQKILYGIIIHKGDYTESISNYTDNMFWNFEPDFSEYLTKEGVVNGDYPAVLLTHVNIIHDNISWIINIANTPVFTYYF
jgi:hypothetical protein